MPDQVTLGAQLRRRREELGLTQSQVAVAAGLVQSAVSGLEAGGGSVRSLWRAAAVVGLRLVPTRGGLVTARLTGRITQDQVAAVVGVDPSALGRWENARAVPSVARLVLWAAAVGVTPALVLAEVADG